MKIENNRNAVVCMYHREASSDLSLEEGIMNLRNVNTEKSRSGVNPRANRAGCHVARTVVDLKFL